MEFIKWHYTKGIDVYIDMWRGMIRANFKFFSLPVLFNSLFAPWKRLSVSSRGPGFSWERFVDQFSFNLASRSIGFLVRFGLILSCFLTAFFIVFTGLFGLGIWMLIPYLSFNSYKRYQEKPEVFVQSLVSEIQGSQNPIAHLFDNKAGAFVLDHVDLDLATITQSASGYTGIQYERPYEGYADLLTHVINSGVWPSDFWAMKGIQPDDLILAGEIWDAKQHIKSGAADSLTSNVKGVGTNLLFGYTPVLDDVGTEILFEKRKATQLRGREDVMVRIDRILDAKRSIILVGTPGIGKRTLLQALALKLDEKYVRLIEASIVKLTKGITDSNERKVKIQSMMSEASAAGNVVLVLKDLPRLTNAEVDGSDYTDVFEDFLSQNKVIIIATTTSDEYEKYIARNIRLMKFFEKIELEQLSPEAATQILIDSAASLESATGITIPIPVLRKMVLSADTLTDDLPYPKKALELLEASVSYAKQQGNTKVTYDDVAQVASEKSGVPLTVLSTEHKQKLANLESHLTEKLIGQETAISLISQSLRTRTMGVSNEKKPIGTFLFLGPTGVGKTETARVLSQVYYGHTNILRFDMAEFLGMEGMTKMIGSMHMNQPGVLTTAIRNKPASLLLFDELEKASSEVYNVMLTLLDEGYIMDAFGRKIDGRNTFLVSTSNAGSELIRELVVQGVTGDELQQRVLNHIQEKRIFSPEFINRFDGVVVYEPLTHSDLTQIAHLKLADLQQRLKEKNIHIDLHPHLAHKVAEDGYDPMYGARPMNRVVNMVIGDIISQAMLSEKVLPGERVLLVPGQDRLQYHIQKV